MADWVTPLVTAGKCFGEGVSLAGHWCADKTYGVWLTHIQIGDAQPIAVEKGQTIRVPEDTHEIQLIGRYRINPKKHKAYGILIRKNWSYWCETRLEFDGNKHWRAHAAFTVSGEHHIVVARMSPEIEILFDYYHQISHEGRRMAAQMSNVAQQQLGGRFPFRRSIEIRERLPGIAVLQEATIEVESRQP